jgi:hypothetical protein
VTIGSTHDSSCSNTSNIIWCHGLNCVWHKGRLGDSGGSTGCLVPHIVRVYVSCKTFTQIHFWVTFA